LAQHCEAAGFIKVRSNLGEEFVDGQANRNRYAKATLDFACETRQYLRCAHPVQPLRACQVEKCLIDRQRLDQRRESEHRLAHFSANLNVFCHVGLYHGGLWTTPSGLEHRHCRTNAVGACDVAGGSHHATLAAADNHRFIGQRGIVSLLDRGVKCVAIDVGDAERRRLGVAHQTR
jgi:hypothetical protein